VSDDRPPNIEDLLADIDREREARKAAFERAISDRRREAERFRQVKDEVVLPVLHRVGRQLERRRHAVKVVEDGRSVVLRVGVEAPSVRQGSLRITWPESAGGKVELEIEGVPALLRTQQMEPEELDEARVTRAALRLVEGLLRGG